MLHVLRDYFWVASAPGEEWPGSQRQGAEHALALRLRQAAAQRGHAIAVEDITFTWVCSDVPGVGQVFGMARLNAGKDRRGGAMQSIRDLVQVAYEAYAHHQGWRNYAGGEIPAWDGVRADIQAGWVAAVQAVLTSIGELDKEDEMPMPMIDDELMHVDRESIVAPVPDELIETISVSRMVAALEFQRVKDIKARVEEWMEELLRDRVDAILTMSPIRYPAPIRFRWQAVGTQGAHLVFGEIDIFAAAMPRKPR